MGEKSIVGARSGQKRAAETSQQNPSSGSHHSGMHQNVGPHGSQLLHNRSSEEQTRLRVMAAEANMTNRSMRNLLELRFPRT
ncbi:hypothetical protein M5689_013292 [Euphorbia peplus]|nr:hypothetical protein M5689_013292 [Euphorbia peplus]